MKTSYFNLSPCVFLVIMMCIYLTSYILIFESVMTSDEDRKWFMEALQSQTIDVVKRMKDITLVMQTPEEVLDSQGVTPSDIEGNIQLSSYLSSVCI